LADASAAAVAGRGRAATDSTIEQTSEEQAERLLRIMLDGLQPTR